MYIKNDFLIKAEASLHYLLFIPFQNYSSSGPDNNSHPCSLLPPAVRWQTPPSTWVDKTGRRGSSLLEGDLFLYQSS